MWCSPFFGSFYWPPSYFPPLGGSPVIGAWSADFRREQYYEALFARLRGLKLGGLVRTAGRKVRLLEEMQPAELPALYMDVARQKMKTDWGNGPHHLLHATVYLYAANPNQAVSADMVLNALLDGVQAAVKPAPGHPSQTLGGIAHAVRMGEDADIEVFAGPNGERAAAIVPIQIEVFQ